MLDSISLSRLLQLCKPDIFCLKRTLRGYESFSTLGTKELLRSLRRLPNLRAVSLDGHFDDFPIDDFAKDAVDESDAIPWPDLQALEVEKHHPYWSQKLSKYLKLQILTVYDLKYVSPNACQGFVENVSKCSNLQAIDMELTYKFEAQEVLEIALGCRSLRKLHIESASSLFAQFTHRQFRRMFKALPHIESVLLHIELEKGYMGCADLCVISNCCPNLTLFDLHFVDMHLTHRSLRDVEPLRRLRAMSFGQIWLSPTQVSYPEELGNFAVEWRRVFPSLSRCEVPCLDDHGNLDSEDLASPRGFLFSSSLASDQVGDDGEMTDSERDSSPPTVDDNPESALEITRDKVKLRRRLWKMLGYPDTSSAFHSMSLKWQTDLEIELLGWPLIPTEVFADPQQYSTRTHSAE